MHNKIFLDPDSEAKHRSGLLGAYFDCFVGWMQEHGYSWGGMRFHIQCVTHFGTYLEKRGIGSIHELEGIRGQKLLDEYEHYWKNKGYHQRNRGLQHYRQALEKAGVLKAQQANFFLQFRQIKQYVEFLKNTRGLHNGTIRRHIFWVQRLLEFLGAKKKGGSLPAFGIADIDKFIEQKELRLKRPTQAEIASVFRCFLRFLYLSGKLASDLSVFITRPRRYKLESLPRVLNWDEIQKILKTVNRSTKMGSRNYAILFLLATYGLRAGEVAGLKLEHIDWKKEVIHITPRKAGKALWLPLIPQAGKAILKYLKHGRPRSKYREVFLRARAPRTLITSSCITCIVRRHIELAGLDPPQRGPHLIRHSFATRLIQRGASLKQIGDLLGHRDPESTHIYTKTATEHLREVALESPEVKL